MNTKLELIELITRLAILIIAGIVVPAFKRWLEMKTENEKMERLKDAARTAVFAAEQICKAAGEQDKDGVARRNMARQAINKAAFKIGVALSEDEINHLMEAAVKELNLVTHTFVIE